MDICSHMYVCELYRWAKRQGMAVDEELNYWTVQEAAMCDMGGIFFYPNHVQWKGPRREYQGLYMQMMQE